MMRKCVIMLAAVLLLCACARQFPQPEHDMAWSDPPDQASVDMQEDMDETLSPLADSESIVEEEKHEPPSLKNDQKLPWQLTVWEWHVADEDFPLYTPLSGQCSVQAPLWQDGPAYTLRFDYAIQDRDVGTEQFAENTYDVVFTVEQEGEQIQQMEFSVTIGYTMPRIYGIIADDDNFVDLNDDGYLDFRCEISRGGNKMYSQYNAWVWNPDEARFDETNFHEIVSPILSRRSNVKGIYGGYSGSASTWRTSIYHYIDGAFVETNRFDKLDRFPGNNYWVDEEWGAIPFQEYHLVDGELVEVWPEYICDTEEGQARIQEHLFGPDSIWFGPDED